MLHLCLLCHILRILLHSHLLCRRSLCGHSPVCMQLRILHGRQHHHVCRMRYWNIPAHLPSWRAPDTLLPGLFCRFGVCLYVLNIQQVHNHYKTQAPTPQHPLQAPAYPARLAPTAQLLGQNHPALALPARQVSTVMATSPPRAAGRFQSNAGFFSSYIKNSHKAKQMPSRHICRCANARWSVCGLRSRSISIFVHAKTILNIL